MNKQEFLRALKKKLSALPKKDIDERLNFYSEMIDDRIEEGLSEEQAVADIGSVDDIASQVLNESYIKTSEKLKSNKKLKTWVIVLLVLGSPIWISLIFSIFGAVISVYGAIWSVVISLWATFGALIACFIVGVIVSFIFAVTGNAVTGLALFGTTLIVAGIAIFLLYGCKKATKGTILLTKKTVLAVKNIFVKRENV